MDNNKEEESVKKNSKIAFYSRTGRSKNRNTSDSKGSKSHKYNSANFSNGGKRKHDNVKMNNKEQRWKDIDSKQPENPQKNGSKKSKKKTKNPKKKGDSYQFNNSRYNDEPFENEYVKKSDFKRKAEKSQENNHNFKESSIASASKFRFEKFDLKEFQEFYLPEIQEKKIKKNQEVVLYLQEEARIEAAGAMMLSTPKQSLSHQKQDKRYSKRVKSTYFNLGNFTT